MTVTVIVVTVVVTVIVVTVVVTVIVVTVAMFVPVSSSQWVPSLPWPLPVRQAMVVWIARYISQEVTSS